ncbi:hypothetical protein [Paenibacillus sp. GCM10023250]|uniref:hypothetical protein n=1 Tax=Paenibacillus sp. GCM10023250 TaxID=3252648 RepID=UPI00360D7DA9
MMRSSMGIGVGERHARIVLDSYRRLTGKPLLETEGRIERAAFWNPRDDSRAYYGQAAAFAGYTQL